MEEFDDVVPVQNEQAVLALMHSETFLSQLIKSYKQQPLDVLESLVHLVSKKAIYSLKLTARP